MHKTCGGKSFSGKWDSAKIKLKMNRDTVGGRETSKLCSKGSTPHLSLIYLYTQDF